MSIQWCVNTEKLRFPLFWDEAMKNKDTFSSQCSRHPFLEINNDENMKEDEIIAHLKKCNEKEAERI